jgi:hypothetical protein
MNPSQIERLLGRNNELCEDNKNGVEENKKCERRPHVIEDAPSRIAPSSSRN